MFSDPITELLQAWGRGDVGARDRVIALVYEELRRRAVARLRRERVDHTLEPAALVHEVYMRLAAQNRVAWQNREQFFGVASQLMRRILVDQARAHRTDKRSGRWTRVTLDAAVAIATPKRLDILDLDRALTTLATLDARKSRIAELRLFCGLSLQETGELLGISIATVERDWQAARAWCFKALSVQPDRSKQ